MDIIIDKKTEGSLIVAFKKKIEGNTKQTCWWCIILQVVVFPRIQLKIIVLQNFDI